MEHQGRNPHRPVGGVTQRPPAVDAVITLSPENASWPRQ